MSTDSFGQTKPTFTEDPLATPQVLRDSAGDPLAQTGHLKGEITFNREEVLPGLIATGTIDLAELADGVILVTAYTTATGAPATKALLAVSTDYTVSEVAITDPSLVSKGDVTHLATPAGGTDSFGQSKPTFVDTASQGDQLPLGYKHQSFNSTTRLTMVTDQSANTLVIRYTSLTQKAHGDLP